MPAHSLDPKDPSNMARLLMCLLMESEKGELRIKGITYDKIDKQRILVTDYDRDTAEIVLRVTSDCGQIAIVQPESFAWTTPQNQSPQNRAQLEAEKSVSRRVMRTDEELAEYEEQRGRESTLAREAQAGKLPRVPFRVAGE